MSKLIIAVDPGKAGGFVWGDGTGVPEFRSMPGTVHEISDLFEDIIEDHGGQDMEMWLEKITGYMAGFKKNCPQCGAEVKGANVSPKSMFSFGKNVGALELASAAFSIPLKEVAPTSWMKKAGISLIKKQLGSDKQWKDHLKAEAQKRFPSLSRNITLKTADAFLIYYAATQ